MLGNARLLVNKNDDNSLLLLFMNDIGINQGLIFLAMDYFMGQD